MGDGHRGVRAPKKRRRANITVEQGCLSSEGTNCRERLSLSGKDWSRASREKLGRICLQLSDPQYQPYEVCRRIAGLIAEITQHLFRLSSTVEDQAVRQELAKQVKVLRLLIKQVIHKQRLRQCDDVCDMDGEKFQFVYKELMDFFGQAMTEGGVEEFQRRMVWRNFRDLASMNEERIRREIEKLGR